MPAPAVLSHPPRGQRGVGLIEVLIAVLVMAIGLLGIAALQATALRNSQSSMERSQAVIQSYTIFDAMRANRAAALDKGEYNIGMTCEVGAATTLAKKDIASWLQSLQRTLGPTTCGKIECAAGLCKVSVRWDDSRATGGSKEPLVIETQVYL
jgi:type IV pilus assembly protein PilV